MKAELISVVEASYDLELDTRRWFAQLLERAGPRLDRGYGVSCWIADPRSATVLEETVTSWQMEDRVVSALLAMIRARPDVGQRVQATRFPPLCTAWQTVGLTEAAARSVYVEYLHPLGIRDGLCLIAGDPEGRLILMSAPTADSTRPSKREVSTWSRVAAHVAAGSRLRHAISRDLQPSPEAIVTPSGAVVDATGAATSRSAREELRDAARAIDRARTRARAHDEEALELWRGLVAGQWSLVDRFDSDGRRFLLARRNDPRVQDPRALTLRERQVLSYVALGHPLKLIAYELGLSISTIAEHKKNAVRKLGVTSLTEIMRLFGGAPQPP